MLIWIRESPAFGAAARQLKLEVTEAYINLIQAFSDSDSLRAAGHQPVPRHRAVMFIGGMREMAALALEGGAGSSSPDAGGLAAVTAEAVDAALSLFGQP